MADNFRKSDSKKSNTRAADADSQVSLNAKKEVDRDWGNIITILVGPNTRKFFVHNHILRQVPFFRGCLDAPMKESQEGVVRLRDDDPDAFQELACWIYNAKFERDLEDDSSSTFLDDDIVDKRLKTYVLAKMMLMEDLQNAAVDSLRAIYNYNCPCARVLSSIQEHLEDDDPLRSFVTRLLACMIHVEGGWLAWKRKNPKCYNDFMRGNADHMELTLQAVSAFSKLPPTSEAKYLAACNFHVHDKTPRCD